MGELKPNVKRVLIIFLLGLVLGFIAKHSDTYPSNGFPGVIWSVISDITTDLYLWVFLAMLLAIWSRTAKLAAVNVFVFFSAMLIVYYLYSMWLFGFFPVYYFLRWGLIALASPVAAYLMWFCNGRGWFAVFCASLPLGLLLKGAWPIYYFFGLQEIISLLFFFIIMFVLKFNKKQYLLLVILATVVAQILWSTDLLSYIVGGL